ncbi:Uncharacterised protein [Streptococcus pneumoniae]|nr:Uncharacterised protein [Streptococcus pneumoniae]
MELVLPNNYVVIDEEEMMYLDGGTNCFLTNAPSFCLVARVACPSE